MILKNAKIYTMEDEEIIENGYVVFNEKIEEIGDVMPLTLMVHTFSPVLLMHTLIWECLRIP